ncbi:catalase [Nocardioides jiangxiensis]|uniref:Catalase n=1 Tax=Nocardioides jiangxiensis TaxID=3064524 RepID=A0ABT9AXN2_9ACTN|nr:catalase [Nocardioides sp. WY-20]MDO7867311.1 catalase [Nocardioides sp. WY-20]
MITPAEAIDRINAVFGRHAGHRALHAKGRFYTATFTPTAEAGRLGRALHLQAPVPVWVRFSNGGGHPGVGDGAPDVRGIGVSFRLPDGTATDLLGQTAPRFPVRTPEDFIALVEHSKPHQLPGFMARHRSAIRPLLANVKAKAVVPPYSYAEATYYPVHAYRWIAPDSTERWVRYVFEPQATKDQRPARTQGKHRLREELEARLAQGPVRFTLRVTVAADGDDPHDPMSVWVGAHTFDAGTLEVTGLDPERETGGEVVVFDPTRVVDGIELSDDPILRYRAGAYSESVARRV